MADDKPAKATIGTERVKVETVTLGGETSVIGDEGSTTTVTKSVTDKMLRTGGLSDKYVFIDEIGRGGMGSVLRVYDTNLRRHVAMKRIIASTSERTRLRFVEEAQITGQLEHPHIVPVHEIGRDANDRIYFTMKLVRGETLNDILDKLREDSSAADQYSLGKLLHSYINVCHAIDFAHSRGVIHRDIKPENIMVGQFGEVQVMDWGLAKAQRVEKGTIKQEQVRDSVTVENQELELDEQAIEKMEPIESVRDDERPDGITMDGQILGTLSYMSPEQARGDNDKVDKRSDVYTLGAILYEILTLHTPVQAKTNEEMIRNICRGKIDTPAERAPDRSIPKELEAIAMKALARIPELRYQSVYELRKDIELYLSGRSVSAKKDTFFEAFTKLILRNKAVSLVLLVSLVSIILLGIFTAKERRKAEENQKEVEELTKEANADSLRQWKSVHTETFDFTQLSQSWDLYTEWSVPPVPVVEAEWPRFIGSDPDGMHIRTNDKPLTILYNKRTVGDVKLSYEVTWLGGTEGGFHAILHGNGWHEGYVFQIGGWSNTKSKLIRADSDGQHVLDEADYVLTPNEQYVIEASIVGNVLMLKINDEIVLSAEEKTEDILAGGPYSHCGFISGENSESIYHNVNISKLGESIKVDILDVADRYMLKAQYQTARDLYQEVHGSISSTERATRARDGLKRANELLELEKSLGSYENMLKRTWRNIDAKIWIERSSLQMDMRGEDVSNLAPLRGMSLQHLNLARCTKVANLQPLEGMPLDWLDISGTSVLDIGPLRRSPIKHLAFDRCRVARGWVVLKFLPLEYLSMEGQELKHLSPLSKNTTLQELNISNCKIYDLKPLANKPLHTLLAAENPISKVDILATLPLKRLDLSGTKLADLEVTRLMPQLQDLSVARTAITDLSPLVHCDLFKLDIAHTKVMSLEDVSTLYLTELHIQNTEITDLSPLKDMQLRSIRLTPLNIKKGMSILREMDSLEFIAIDDAETKAAADFWELWDMQESVIPEFEESIQPDN